MKKRIFVFIDGSNFYHGLKEIVKPSELTAYYDFFDFLVGKYRKLEGIIYYVGKINKDTGFSQTEKDRSLKLFNGQDQFINKLKASGIRCRLGYFPKEGKTEKGVDVKIAVDMIKFAYEDLYDIAFLVSGDGDLVDAVKMVREIGKTVCNVFFLKGNHSSFRLRDASNNYFFIDKQTKNFVKWYNKSP